MLAAGRTGKWKGARELGGFIGDEAAGPEGSRWRWLTCGAAVVCTTAGWGRRTSNRGRSTDRDAGDFGGFGKSVTVASGPDDAGTTCLASRLPGPFFFPQLFCEL